MISASSQLGSTASRTLASSLVKQVSMWMPSRPRSKENSPARSSALASRCLHRAAILPVVHRLLDVTQHVLTAQPHTRKRLGFFERYLTLWVALCMAAGVLCGRLLPSAVQTLRGLEFGRGSQINIPIAVLIWLMITPMMMKVDFGALRNVGRKPAGLVITLIVNWLVKPFSMALLAWLFFRFVFSGFISRPEADQYIAGCIILAAAPCTAMVFV